MTLEIGTKVGSYEIIEKYRESGLEIVYKAKHVLLDRLFLVKCLKDLQKDSNKRDWWLKWFQKEIKAQSRVNHPNVLKINDVFEFDGLLHSVTDFIENGKSLDDLIKEKGKLAPDEAVKYCLQASNALKACHEAGIVHRDVKPANFIIGAHGDLYLCDFGFACIGGQDDLLEEGTTVGTPEFMAPEAINCNKDIDPMLFIK